MGKASRTVLYYSRHLRYLLRSRESHAFPALMLGTVSISSLSGLLVNAFVFSTNKWDIKKLTEVDVRLNKNWEDGRCGTDHNDCQKWLRNICSATKPPRIWDMLIF